MNETKPEPEADVDSEAESGPSSRRLVRVGVFGAVLVLAAFGAGLLVRWRHRAALAEEMQALAVPTVAVVAPVPGKPPSGLLVPAEVKPWMESPIYARASGYVKRWRVDLGAHVEKGQLLAEIETPETDQELLRTRHELAQVEASLALAELTAARYTELVKSASVGEQETDEKQADLSVKTAQVKALRANTRRLEEIQSFARVTAPFAGTVTAREIDVGELIVAGSSKVLFRLAQTQKLRAFVRVPQTRALKIAPGQPAELLVPELPLQVFRAQVARTAGVVSADSRTLLVELEVDNTKGEILAGSFAQVRFTGGKGAAALTLPGNTLLFRAEGPQVGVVGRDGKVDLRSVTLGRDFGPTVEILDGVKPEDRVIVNPSDSLAGGTVVRIALPAAKDARP
jgi:membrane fusion protein (multidrug efflux system)